MSRYYIVTLCLLSLCSCQAFQPQRVRDVYVNSEYADSIGQAELLLDTLTVKKGFDSRALEANATYIFHLMLEQRNQALPHPGKSLSLHAFIKEEEFSRDFQIRQAVTVELSIFDPPEKNAVALVLYSENTKETIASYTYMHSVIRRALHSLTR
jgi:hypothetical protein